MKKSGFTLTEVLITLGIIGVIAALTTPALVKNTGQAHIGPSLSKFVNTWESACNQLFQDEHFMSIGSIGQDLTAGSRIMDSLSKYMIMSPMTNTERNNYHYHAPDGSRDIAIYSGYAYKLKDGSIIWGETSSVSSASMQRAQLGRYTDAYGDVMIDINGPRGNNCAGKEVFRFTLTNTGTLIPYGGSVYKSILPNNNTLCSISSNNEYRGFACTGVIADNGWVADY